MSAERRPTAVVVMLARNASASIGAALRAAAAQDIFSCASSVDASCLVVVNGTTDDTAAVARATWDRVHANAHQPTLRIETLERAGKSNAWNEAVHRLTDESTDVLVFVDADIWFEESCTLRRLVERLMADDLARVTAPTPRKSTEHIRSGLYRRLAERSNVSPYGASAVAGGCYAIRRSFAATMELPSMVVVEDGFVHAMAMTDQFTTASTEGRVVRVADTAFWFEAEPTLRSLLRHERKLIIGGTYNAFAFDALHEICGPGHPAGPIMAERNLSDPLWIDRLILEARANGTRWFVPRGYLTRRVQDRDFRHQKLGDLALSVVAIAADVAVSAWANHYYRTFRSALKW